jgi:hypothetical protein
MLYWFCPGAKTILNALDWYVGDRIWRWMTKKHQKAGAREIMHSYQRIKGRRNWRSGKEELFLMGRLKVEAYRFAWMRRPDYAMISGEPSA